MADQFELPTILEFSVDLAKAEAPEPLPVGNYRGVVKSTKQRESQAGNRYVEVGMTVSPDQYPVDFKDGNPDGTLLFFRRVSAENTPAGRYSCRRFCEAIGAPLSKSPDISEWVGLEAGVEVGHDTHEGVTRAAINRVLAL